MPTPVVYRKAGPASASYDWLDITSGVGYRRYYGTAWKNGATTEYFLAINALDARPEKTTAASQVEKDFDITFNRPAIVANADAVFNATIESDGGTQSLQITVIHYDGSTETSLGTNITGTSGIGVTRECVKIHLTEKHFAIGDILRITVKAISGNNATLWHDPGNGTPQTDIDGRTVNVDILCDIPFKIDLT